MLQCSNIHPCSEIICRWIPVRAARGGIFLALSLLGRTLSAPAPRPVSLLKHPFVRSMIPRAGPWDKTHSSRARRPWTGRQRQYGVK